MRIMTMVLPVASAPADVYCHVNVDALLAMLVHKIGNVVLQQGLEQGQGLLQDWLVLFVAAFNHHRGIQPKLPQEVSGCAGLGSAQSSSTQSLLLQQSHMNFNDRRKPMQCIDRHKRQNC